MVFVASRIAHVIRSQGVSSTRLPLSRTIPCATPRQYVSKASPKPVSAAKKASSPTPSEAEQMGATTSAAELHPLPDSVKAAGIPSTGSQKPQFDASGNSTSPTAHSSRPAAPGPSSPPVDPSVAAPRFRGGEGGEGGSGSGRAAYSTSAAAASSAAPPAEPSSIPKVEADWGTSFDGMSMQPFAKEVSQILEAPINEQDIEIKPDGLLYLPEIKYRRILNKAFGPGGWGLAPRTETNVTDKIVSREWALICLGRFVSTARGEQEYFDPSGVATASEGAKSNALMRCCKDLGIAHELWSPRFIREFKQKMCVEVFVENVATKKKKKLWRRKDTPPFDYPWKEGR